MFKFITAWSMLVCFHTFIIIFIPSMILVQLRSFSCAVAFLFCLLSVGLGPTSCACAEPGKEREEVSGANKQIIRDNSLRVN